MDWRIKAMEWLGLTWVVKRIGSSFKWLDINRCEALIQSISGYTKWCAL